MEGEAVVDGAWSGFEVGVWSVEGQTEKADGGRAFNNGIGCWDVCRFLSARGTARGKGGWLV